MISKLTEEKMSAIQQNQKMRQELVRCPDILAINTVASDIILELFPLFPFNFHPKYYLR
jgi:hypothetical protein